MHKFFHFAHLKSTFSILHTYFYKTPTSVCLFYTFIQIKYSFLYPHSHRPTATDPHRHHTGIHTTHRQQTQQFRKINPATRSMHPESTQSTQSSNPELKQTQQHNPHNPPEIDASPWATRLTPPVAMARTRNKIDASKGKRWQWRWRWRETFNPKPTDQKPIQPKNNEKQRKKERSEAAMAIDES